MTYDVTSTNPQRLLHAISVNHGPGSNSFGDAGVANLAYYVEPGTGLAGLLVMDSLNTPNLTALLPGGDIASFRFGDELEMTSNHNRGGSVGTASVDCVENTYTLVAAGAPPPSVNLVPTFIGANAVLGGFQGTGSVNLNAPAQAGGALVTLTSSNPALASIPATVRVPQGALSAPFPITTAPVTQPATGVGLSATLNGTTIQGTVQIFPAPPLAVATITLAPTVVTGGSPLNVTVTMNIPVQNTPATILLTSSNTALSVPASVVVPVGASSVTFAAASTPVTVPLNITITATFGGASVTGTATINPAPGAVFSLSVTHSGNGLVTATPGGNGAVINCGKVCTANFNQGTTVTLTATPPSGKSFVAWSGGCSGVQPVCTLKMSSNEAIQAAFK